MIRMLRGNITNINSTNGYSLVCDVGGVGYLVHISRRLHERLTLIPRDVHETMSTDLHTHLIVRENLLALYGFHTDKELATFEDLIGMQGVGPNLAMKILSHFSVPELVAAVGRGDVQCLVACDGVGKKTAEMLVVALKKRWEGKAQ